MIYIGIDPGNSGGIAYIEKDKMESMKFPKNITDVVLLLKTLKAIDNCIAYMELVHSFPNQGVKSCFTFGENFGKWKGLLAMVNIEYKLIPPRTWMLFFGPLSKEKKDRKKELKQIAKKLYANNKVTLYTADAILIAHYLKETINEKS